MAVKLIKGLHEQRKPIQLTPKQPHRVQTISGYFAKQGLNMRPPQAKAAG